MQIKVCQSDQLGFFPKICPSCRANIALQIGSPLRETVKAAKDTSMWRSCLFGNLADLRHPQKRIGVDSRDHICPDNAGLVCGSSKRLLIGPLVVDDVLAANIMMSPAAARAAGRLSRRSRKWCVLYSAIKTGETFNEVEFIATKAPQTIPRA